jgi:hypothetical protein
MGEQIDAIEDRLEGLKQDDRRMMFDSTIRAVRLDSKEEVLSTSQAAKVVRAKAASSLPIEPIISLLEELSRRIDGLERKDLALSGEIRRRARQDYRRRSIVVAGSLLFGAGLYICRMLKLF